MSVTGKTLGIVLVGLIGLLSYVGVYVSGAIGLHGVAYAASYLGVALTFTMLVVVSILAAG
ncbi:hypothetical protein [Insolitispirillum peregrinum]|uniref:Uncharacterized protein n=1 Tax=Insolitispirillum peregrinum TaxID=80876 RepID=A0A1N7L3W1_9PROT|nr:hypothetical protein [Insolitispirillum peregrinum]SIS68497.1 hypothetical protein SAMN05421779_10395 [Insolitispirillum peregrinum]